MRRPEPVHPAGCQQAVANDSIEQCAGVVVEFPRGGAVPGMIEDPREPSLELPRGEKERPVDVGDEVLQPHIIQDVGAGEARRRHVLATPVESRAIRLRRWPGEQRPSFERGVLSNDGFLLDAVGRVKGGLVRGVEQLGHDVDRARGVEHVHDRLAELRSDLHRRMLTARRRAADQQRDREAAALHFARHEHHLIERRRDEAAESHEIGPFIDGRLQDAVGGRHDAEGR